MVMLLEVVPHMECIGWDIAVCQQSRGIGSAERVYCSGVTHILSSSHFHVILGAGGVWGFPPIAPAAFPLQDTLLHSLNSAWRTIDGRAYSLYNMQHRLTNILDSKGDSQKEHTSHGLAFGIISISAVPTDRICLTSKRGYDESLAIQIYPN